MNKYSLITSSVKYEPQAQPRINEMSYDVTFFGW